MRNTFTIPQCPAWGLAVLSSCGEGLCLCGQPQRGGTGLSAVIGQPDLHWLYGLYDAALQVNLHAEVLMISIHLQSNEKKELPVHLVLEK